MVAVAAGDQYTVALKDNGTVAAWGYNEDGQINVPAGLSGVSAIAASSHTVALKSNGTVVAWGHNVWGQSIIPAGLSGVSAIAAGGTHTVALLSNGTVVAWGQNNQGQTTIPAGLSGVSAVAAGLGHTMALKSNGTVVAWGSLSYGVTTVPVGLNGVVSISASYHSVALKSDGTVVAWGYNGHGETNVPVGLSGVVAIAAGGGHTVALRSNGMVTAWGNTEYGVINVPPGLSGVVAISAGGVHTAVISRQPTAITGQPGSQIVEVGQSVSFNVVATGTAPFSYQWSKNGANIPDETNASYTIPAAVKSDAGNYSVVVSNSVSSATSSNALLTVIVLPSPFIAAKGMFNGLFYDRNAPAHFNAGAFSLMLDDKGGVRGTVRQGAKARKFSGTFSLERTARVTMPATTSDPALSLDLEIDFVNAAITGLASNAHFISTVTAYRNPFSPKALPAPTVGNYNAALPGADAAPAPVGDGFATLAVSTAGRVSTKFTLADSTAFSLVTATSAGAQVPVYAALYGGRGSLFGWLTVTNSASNDVPGTLWWTKPGTVGGALYPAGFTNQTEVLGSRYVAPPAHTPVLTLTNGAVLLSGDGLVDALTNSATLGSDNKITSGNGIAFTIAPAKGAVSGSFLDPITGKKHTVKGLALPQQNEARGFFLGTGTNGLMRVEEHPGE